MEIKMTGSEWDKIESAPDAIEPGSLEWFRVHAQLPLVLRAFFEVEEHRVEFGHLSKESAEAACDGESEIWDLLTTAEILAERFEQFSDPNAEEIVTRLRKLTGCAGRLSKL
jgi:hypothetical protein